MFTWLNQVDGIRVLPTLLIHAVLFCFVVFFCIYVNFICLYLNTKNQVLHRQTIFIGSLNTSIVHPREVFKEAFRRAAASIICLHNHPSGDPTPSREDIEVTKRLVECGQIIGIEVLDHIIIGDHKFVSLKEKGHI
ncbi:DNA repair protein RadC [Bacillus thuringiensis]|nr:DNA repair protein RadC [Bacillus thuringiensis]